MIRLYVRTLVVMLLSFTLTWSVVLFVAMPTYEEAAALHMARVLESLDVSAALGEQTEGSTGGDVPRALVSRDELLARAGLGDETRASLRAGRIAASHDGPMMTLYAPASEQPGMVVAYGPLRSYSAAESVEANLWWAPLELSFYMAAVALVVIPLYRRLARLRDAALRISGGELDARASVDGGDVVGELGRSFNEMAARVESLITTQRQLTRAVSHEFRTPIARLRFAAELAAGEDNAEARAELFRDMDRDIGEIDALVEEMLTYARLEQGSPAVLLKRESFDLREALSELAARPPHAPGKSLEFECPEGLLVNADRGFLVRAVQNLVGNGLRHARERVAVRCSAEPPPTSVTVTICVDDDGPGIPAADRPRVFEPFTRLEGSRTRLAGGAGLGLAIARRISEWHGGEITIADSPLGGARFELRWPVGQATPRA